MAFKYYKSLTLSEAQSGTADSTNWTLAICLDGNVQPNDPDLRTTTNYGYVENANGYDIRPYSDVGLTTALKYELVYYDGNIGGLEMHVKIPTLSTTTDTVIYLAFGDASLNTDGSDGPNTYDTNAKLVAHLSTGSSISLKNSITGTNLTNNGTTPSGKGQLDGGALLNGTNQSLTTTTPPTTNLDNWTLSIWVNLATLSTGGFPSLIYNGDGTTGGYGMIIDNTTQLVIIYETVTIFNSGYIFPATDAWHYCVARRNAGTATLFVDNVQKGTSTASTPAAVSGFFGLGAEVGSAHFFQGSLDEARVATSPRSDSWITAEYNNQKSSSTFITWSAKIFNFSVPTITGVTTATGPSTITF